MKGVEKEMDDFQKEKQGALNQIDVALTLSLRQVTAEAYCRTAKLSTGQLVSYDKTWAWGLSY